MSTSKDGDAQGPEESACGAPAGTAEAASSAKGQKPPSPHNCRNFIRRHTATAMPAIVDTFVEKAKGGSVPHFTSLAKVGGFDQRSGVGDAPKKRRTRSLARQLLDEVERYEAQQKAEKDAAAAQTENQNGNRSPQENS